MAFWVAVTGDENDFFVAVTGDENDFFVAEAGRSVIAILRRQPGGCAAFE